MISPVVFRSVPKCVRVVSERLFVGPKLGIFGLTRLKKGGDVTLVVDLCRKKDLFLILKNSSADF